MSDPLSIAAGIVGVITAAAQMSVLLTKFTKSTIAAPQQAQVVLTEVSDIRGILSHLQTFLLGSDSPNRSRTSLLKVEKVVTIVGGCVHTFSELERLLDELKTEDLDVLDRLKWARKEPVIVSLIDRLQNHKASLSLVLNIVNGFVPIRQELSSEWVLIFRRHTIAQATDSVSRLHELVEQCYKGMSSRVQALEILDLQRRGGADWMSVDDTESLATIHARPPDLSDEEAIGNELLRFDFSDDLQRSRVYRRNQAFRKAVISALTNSVYSLGWSYFSDLSMAEVSNISVINLAITEEETYNPQRSTQTWSAQAKERASTGPYNSDYRDRQHTQLHNVVREPIPANSSAAAWGRRPASTRTQQQSLHRPRSLPPPHPFEDHYSPFQLEVHYRDKTSANITEDPGPKSNLPLAGPSDPLLYSQPQSTSSQSDEPMEDEPAYPCRGCGKIIGEWRAFELGEPYIVFIRYCQANANAEGSRWHLDCFCCNTCGIIVGPNADLYLLGDGSLICNNCTYSCGVCNNKIEDLVILTGKKTLWETCSRCRGCKKKIENLKYARTSQGFFCMECHESLMQRRRRKT